MSNTDVGLTPQVLIDRARVVANQVLAPAMMPDREPLRLEVFQTPDRLSYAEAVSAKNFRPATTPFRWGPLWSTAWFRVSGRTPRHWSGGDVVLHACLNGEALVWRDGKPYHGVSPFHSRIPLLDGCRGGEPIELIVEAAANQLFGRLDNVPDDHAEEPAIISTLELARVDPAVFAFSVDLDFAAELLGVSLDLLNPNRNWGGFTDPALMSPETRHLARALDNALNRLRDSDLGGTLPGAHRILREALKATSAARTTSRVVGHSHIDVAWLWPLAETRRKCSRTFSSMLRHMERDKDFVYVQSQAQLYAFVEEDYPEIIEQIDRRVLEGRWEAGGAMWVEADCNLASGESLVRQLLHGINYWKKRWGEKASQHRYLWLPDVFGYSAALPQILRHCGLDTFFTQKISWNETNRFPHTTFWWQGIDGSRVLSHFFPTDNYNGQVTPRELLRGDYNNQQADQIPFWLNPAGYGDGGGGPNAEILQRVQTSSSAPLLPRVKYQLPGAFSDDLHQAAESVRLPLWQGELYLELHRGTLTTQAQVKHCNRLTELGLREVELWSYLAWGGSERYPAQALDRIWKTALLHQFHDVLPGSSIGAVYEDTRRDYAALLLELNSLREKALGDLTRHLASESTKEQQFAVFNAAEHCRNGVVDLSEHFCDADEDASALVYLDDIPALGAVKVGAGVAGMLPDGVMPVKTTGRTLDNGLIRIVLDAAGRVRSLILKSTGRDAVATGQPMNQLVLYADRPNNWDAWDINRHYLNMGDPVVAAAEMKTIQSGPLRGIIEVRRPLGAGSQMVQHIQLDAGSARLDFKTWINWHENHRLLRVLHPVDVVSDFATMEIQFGHVRRATHVNTSWDSARFESPAHTWMDLSERGFGVALLNDAKYGHSCIDNVMGVSLLRAPRQPDDQADLGEHVFTYSLMPHEGDPIADGVPEQARALNMPLRVVPVSGVRPAALDRPDLHPFDLPPGIRVECFKKAEESDDLIVRLVESAGSRHTAEIPWSLPIRSVEAVDALEQPTDLFKVHYNAKRNSMNVDFTPFAIRTLKVKA